MLLKSFRVIGAVDVFISLVKQNPSKQLKNQGSFTKI